ncbi:hypothetical protein [Bradyrhizobium sp. SZCCHNRI2007]|uniref:hypothetical protein n=1 Tax=Bradyrhizobium sp. SZCCHNRI2007 TaxID=3057281 RepID=UPI0028E5A2C1|nr:hypothetical protein [Bradyrhizobium sp. SZCCHNRI2007]
MTDQPIRSSFDRAQSATTFDPEAQLDATIDAHLAKRSAGNAGKTPGQLAYEADCALQPNYGDGDGHLAGMLRKPWHLLSDIARDSWERNPTVRAYHRKPVESPEPRG